MQGNNLPPQYQLPPSLSVAGAARSPSPSPVIPGLYPTRATTASPTPARYGTQRKVIERYDDFPPVPPPPVPPKTPSKQPALPQLPQAQPLSGSPATRRDERLEGLKDDGQSSSSSSRAGLEESIPPSPSTGTYRIPVSPRKRKVFKAGTARSPRSPRREKNTRPSSARNDHPSLLSTLGYLLLPFRLVAAPFQAVFSPVIAHCINVALLAILVAIVGYIVAARLHSIAGLLPPLVAEGVLFPLRTIATPSCFLINFMCPLSLLTEGNSTAGPFWRLLGSSSSVDVARVSRSLSTEVRVARDIFDSLSSLGDGRMMEGLAHVRIHELGIAIQTGSTLDERFFIGQELVELADTASSVADEIVKINAMSVSIFSWLFWEFSHIVKLLDLPENSRPSTSTLSSRLDSLVSRLDADLDRLYSRVGAAIPVAERGAQQGWQLHEHLSFIHSDLRAEHEKYPTWQRALEAGKKFFAGGDPSKLTRISRDLDITRNTINGITETRNSLERVRIGLVAFRDQVRHFSASVMGLHLGADVAIGLGPEEELAILSTVVGELGHSVGRAKRGVGASDDRPRIEA